MQLRHASRDSATHSAAAGCNCTTYENSYSTANGLADGHNLLRDV